jgi:hypothetical protein
MQEPFDTDESGRRAAVATNAGLSEVHGGPSKELLRYQVECPEEQGLVLSIERIWPKENGEAPQDMFIVCPVCGEEHTLVQRT